MEEPLLKRITRPIIAIEIITTLCISLFIEVKNQDMFDTFAVWGGIVITTYFAGRWLEKIPLERIFKIFKK